MEDNESNTVNLREKHDCYKIYMRYPLDFKEKSMF
jgi:hypothetical protein